MSSTDIPRILYVKHILEQYSDESHPLSLSDIKKYLYELSGQTGHRDTLTRDITALTAFGLDIITIHSTQNRYFVGSRLFELPELRLLADAIHSSRCLTDKKSEALIRKLSTLTNIRQAEKLSAHPHSITPQKPINEQIYYIIDAINAAIDRSRKIRFQYTEYTAEKKQVLRGDGEWYTLSPYACVWSGDYYYVIGWSDKRETIVSFRVDRIAHTPILCDETADTPPEGFDVREYASTMFRMYQGDNVEVELLCENELMKSIIDRFGVDVCTEVADDEHFRVIATVALSPTFYGWVFSFGGRIRLLSPSHAVDAYRSMLTDACAAHPSCE